MLLLYPLYSQRITCTLSINLYEVVGPLTSKLGSSRSYYTLISVGNATFRVALDTGSADLWLISSACTNSSCSVPKYQLGYPSPTFVSINSNQTVFNVSFADTTSELLGSLALEFPLTAILQLQPVS